MKNKIILLIIFISSISILAQPTVDLQIVNPSVSGSKFSFEIHILRTNTWDVLNLNSLGNCSYYFDINSAALSSPTLTFISSLVSTSHTNTTAFNNVGGTNKLRITSTATGAGGAVSDVAAVHLYTVELDIDDAAQSSNLSWDQTNTGLTNALNVAMTESYSGDSDTPLPVELSSFKVNSVEGTKAKLQWETATEVNNYGFEIERAVKKESAVENNDNQTNTDPSAPVEMNWEKVAFVEGHGNSNSPKLYSFTDESLIGGSKFIYRLKQIDIDGSFEYSDEVEVEVLPTKYELFQNYPNPFNPSTLIKFSLPEDTKLAINVYNLLGEKVTTLLNNELKAGFHEVNFNSASAGYSLASGVYIYTIESKNFTQVKKMILMK